jgi:hypothetical protein
MASKEVAVVEKKVSPLVAKAEAFEITGPKDMEGAATLLSQMNKANDLIKEEKDKTYKPAYATVVAIRKQWKPLEDMFETGIQGLRRKISAYQTEAKRIADAEAAKIAARVAPGKGNLSPETALKKMDEIDEPEQVIATDAGLLKFRTEPRFEVMDVSKLPAEYLLANEPAIRKAMKDGIELPGVRYYEEQVPVNIR